MWRVSGVVDGNTIRVRRTDGSSEETVRLVGIDTPETKKSGVSVECGGPLATASMLAFTFDSPSIPTGTGSSMRL